MQGVSSGKMEKLIVALQKVDALEVADNKLLLRTLHEMLPADDIELISRFFTFPGQDVLMTDANCIKLKLFMAIGMINFVFKARFTIILRGGFAVRMNILKKKQTVDSFKATKDMNDLLMDALTFSHQQFHLCAITSKVKIQNPVFFLRRSHAAI